MLFYVQSKTNNDTYKSRFANNFSALTSYSLYGNNNTSLLNNIQKMDYYTQRDVVDEHFKNFFFLNDPDALITYDQVSVINFCMNPHNALSGDVMGG